MIIFHGAGEAGIKRDGERPCEEDQRHTGVCAYATHAWTLIHISVSLTPAF